MDFRIDGIQSGCLQCEHQDSNNELYTQCLHYFESNRNFDSLLHLLLLFQLL